MDRNSQKKAGKQVPKSKPTRNVVKKVEVYKHFDPTTKQRAPSYSGNFPELIMEKDEPVKIPKPPVGGAKRKSSRASVSSVTNAKKEPMRKYGSKTLTNMSPPRNTSKMSTGGRSTRNSISRLRSSTDSALLSNSHLTRSNINSALNQVENRIKTNLESIKNKGNVRMSIKDMRCKLEESLETQRREKFHSSSQRLRQASCVGSCSKNPLNSCSIVNDTYLQNLKNEISASKPAPGSDISKNVMELREEIIRYRQSLNKNVNFLQGRLKPHFASNKPATCIPSVCQSARDKLNQSETPNNTPRQSSLVEDAVVPQSNLIGHGSSGEEEPVYVYELVREEDEIPRDITEEQEEGLDVDINFLEQQKENIQKVDQLIEEAEHSLIVLKKEFYGSADRISEKAQSKRGSPNESVQSSAPPLSEFENAVNQSAERISSTRKGSPNTSICSTSESVSSDSSKRKKFPHMYSEVKMNGDETEIQYQSVGNASTATSDDLQFHGYTKNHDNGLEPIPIDSEEIIENGEESYLNTISERTEVDNTGTSLTISDPVESNENPANKLTIQHMPQISIRAPLVTQMVFEIEIKPTGSFKLEIPRIRNVCYEEVSHVEGPDAVSKSVLDEEMKTEPADLSKVDQNDHCCIPVSEKEIEPQSSKLSEENKIIYVSIKKATLPEPPRLDDGKSSEMSCECVVETVIKPPDLNEINENHNEMGMISDSITEDKIEASEVVQQIKSTDKLDVNATTNERQEDKQSIVSDDTVIKECDIENELETIPEPNKLNKEPDITLIGSVTEDTSVMKPELETVSDPCLCVIDEDVDTKPGTESAIETKEVIQSIEPTDDSSDLCPCGVDVSVVVEVVCQPKHGRISLSESQSDACKCILVTGETNEDEGIEKIKYVNNTYKAISESEQQFATQDLSQGSRSESHSIHSNSQIKENNDDLLSFLEVMSEISKGIDETQKDVAKSTDDMVKEALAEVDKDIHSLENVPDNKDKQIILRPSEVQRELTIFQDEHGVRPSGSVRDSIAQHLVSMQYLPTEKRPSLAETNKSERMNSVSSVEQGSKSASEALVKGSGSSSESIYVLTHDVSVQASLGTACDALKGRAVSDCSAYKFSSGSTKSSVHSDDGRCSDSSKSVTVRIPEKEVISLQEASESGSTYAEPNTADANKETSEEMTLNALTDARTEELKNSVDENKSVDSKDNIKQEVQANSVDESKSVDLNDYTEPMVLEHSVDENKSVDLKDNTKLDDQKGSIVENKTVDLKNNTKHTDTQTLMTAIIQYESKGVQKSLEDSSYLSVKLHKHKKCKDIDTSTSYETDVPCCESVQVSEGDSSERPSRNTPYGDSVHTLKYLKMHSNGRYEDEAEDFCEPRSHEPSSSTSGSRRVKKVSKYPKQRVPAMKYDSNSIELEDTLSEGEIKCKCSVSIGELHLCRCSPDIKAQATYFKKHPDKLLNYALGETSLHVVRKKAYYDNWIAYYTSPSNTPTSNGVDSNETSSDA